MRDGAIRGETTGRKKAGGNTFLIWNEVVIIAKGNNIRHYLNNRLILDFTDDDPKRALFEKVWIMGNAWRQP